MTDTISIHNKNIRVIFREHSVHVIAGAELMALLSHNTAAVTLELVEAIQLKYQSVFNADFKVSQRSMAVEIWGHVYADKLMIALQSISVFGFLKRLIEKIKKRLEKIDIGERGHDYNRFFWDGLSFLQPAIAKLFPKE
jgi:hypothetical protein